MTINKTFYELLKFIIVFVIGLPVIITAVLNAFGVDQGLINIINVCVNAFGALAILFVNTCAKNHWKAVASDGTTEDIEEIDTEDSTVAEIATDGTDYDDDIDE